MIEEMWKKIFAKKKAPTTNDSIDSIRNNLQLLDKRDSYLSDKIQQEDINARKALKNNNRTLAMASLKRKKVYEQQLQRINSQKSNLETVLLQVEEATMNIETVNAQKQGAEALRRAYGGLSADKIEDEMDKVRDAMEDHREITNALGQSNVGESYDEDELLAELEMLDTIEELPNIPSLSLRDEVEEDEKVLIKN